MEPGAAKKVRQGLRELIAGVEQDEEAAKEIQEEAD
jgi:hypothetical protein